MLIARVTIEFHTTQPTAGLTDAALEVLADRAGTWVEKLEEFANAIPELKGLTIRVSQTD